MVWFLAELAPEWRQLTPADPVATIAAGQVLARPGLGAAVTLGATWARSW